MVELETRRCAGEDFFFDEEMNYVGDNTKTELSEEEEAMDGKPFFFPPDTYQINWFRTYHPKMHCLVEKAKI